jgi:hypothetical protein
MRQNALKKGLRTSVSITFFIFGVWLVAFRSSAAGDNSSSVIEITSDPQVFLDDLLIDRTDGVWRSVAHPSKFSGNPVVKPDRPWEGYLILQPGTVLLDKTERVFKMWYVTAPTKDRPAVTGAKDRPWEEGFLCYAISRDGVVWEKPDLGLVEFHGSRANNILLTQVDWTHSLIKDDDDLDQSKRYKLLYWQTWNPKDCGTWVAFSADGIHWRKPLDYPVVPCSATGDTFSVMRDPVSNQYFLFHKTVLGPIRKVSRLVSDDFVNWRDDRQVLEPDGYDQPDTEFYGMSAFHYAGQYVGMLWVFHTYLQVMDTQLTSSRDGLHWERALSRKIFLPLGYMVLEYAGHSFDDKMIFPSSAPVQKDDQLWLYYSGFSNTHNVPSVDHTGQIGLATLRLDGFCSLDATSEGFIVTRPLKFRGSAMFVNAELGSVETQAPGPHPAWRHLFTNSSSGEGYVRVEVEDELERPIQGYTASDCEPLRESGVNQRVSWGGIKDLSSLRGRAVRLRFVLANAKLFSFKIQ